MSHKNNNKEQIVRTKNEITALLGQLKKLAPHPTQGSSERPLTLAHHDSFKPVNENDAMLGSLVMESMLGGVFNAMATNDNSAVSIAAGTCLSNDAVMELAGELLSDKEDECYKKAHGRGTYALGLKKAISPAFAQASDPIEAFQADLPERLQIEERLQDLSEDLDDLYAAYYNPETPALPLAI